MIIPLDDVLNIAAKSKGIPSWNVACQQCKVEALNEMFASAALELSQRGFHAGWSERAKRVTHKKAQLDQDKAKELSYISGKLLRK